ncbi:MAG: hypothetical protein GY749_31815 [Desulfobacteraceae bacterium]|nr:hypothetical protein [Desulfobacteraceae bacterium]
MKFENNPRWKYIKFVKPRRMPEPVIQAEIYRRLRDRKIKCIIGCPIYCEDYEKDLFPDLAILHEGYIVGLVEIKSFRKSKSVSDRIINNLDEKELQSKQLKRYLLYNLPLYYCTSWEGINKAVEFAELCIREFGNRFSKPASND